MKALGSILLIFGIIFVFSSMVMDTSVSTGYGTRVNNIGLMRDQQNYLILGSVFLLGGLLVLIFRKPKASLRDEVECPHCAEKILSQAKVCKHCGRDVADKISDEKLGDNKSHQFLWYENNVLTLNRENIIKYAHELNAIMPSQTISLIMQAHSNVIQDIKSSMPINLADEFVVQLETSLRKIKNQ